MVPLGAVRTFVDPSVRFGLKFDPHEAGEADLDALIPEDVDEEADGDEGEPGPAGDAEPDEKARRKPGAGADVVSLDRFRKH